MFADKYNNRMSHLPKTAAEKKRRAVFTAYRIVFGALLMLLCGTADAQTADARRAAPDGIFPSQTSRSNLAKPLEKCWQYAASNTINMASDNANDLYTSNVGGKIYAVNAVTGEKIWETDLGGEIISVPAADATGIYVATGYSTAVNAAGDSPNEFDKLSAPAAKKNRTAFGTIRRLNKITGVTVWKRDFSENADARLFSYGDSVIVVNNRKAYSLGKIDGKLLWESRFDSEMTSVPYFSGSQLLLGFKDRLTTLLIENNEIREGLNKINEPTAISQSLDRHYLLWGDQKGFVYSFDTKLKKIVWRFRSGAQISFLKNTAEGLLIVSNDNFIYLLTEKTGKLIWKKRLAGRITSEPLLTGGFAVFTPLAEPNAVVVELSTGRSVNNINLSGGAFFTGAAISIEEILIFQTSEGIQAFSDPAICRQK